MRSPLAACYLLLSVAAGCSDRASNSGESTGGTLVIVYPGSEPSPLLPTLTTDVLSRLLVDQIYDRLAEIGPDLSTQGDRGFRPRLAKSWTWAPDSMAIAFAIDPRARWHDGQPVTARDVAFSFALDKDPKSASMITATIGNVDSVTVRDSMTAVAWFHRRTPEQFYDFVYQIHILPEHILKGIPHDKLGESEVIRTPIGTGRFRFVRWDPGVRIELIADTANFRGRAKLDRVIISLVPDGSAAITQLLSGQADFFENVPAAVIPRVDSSAQVRAMRYPGLGYAYMAMNNRDPKRPGAPHPIFGDRRVRRAISMALDRQSMLRNVFDTLGVLGSGPFSRTFADTTLTLLPFDRAQAAALLDSAGWRAGADGIRAKNGRVLAFPLLVPTSSVPRMRYAVLIQEQLKSVGARVNIEAVDISNFMDRSDARSFDAALSSTNSDPARSGIKQNWHSEALVKGGQNAANYSSRTFDTLIDSATNIFDKTRADDFAHRAYQTLIDDAPAVWLYDILSIAGIHKRLRPEEVRADEWWAGLADWSIPANERIDRDRIGLRPAQP
jgi:peptide/nickel transport system substrate-binding protein